MARKLKVVSFRSAGNAKALNPLEDARILQETINALRNKALIPRGLFRFSSFEESHQWMTKAIAATHARLNSKT